MRVYVEGSKGDETDFPLYLSYLILSGKYSTIFLADLLDVPKDQIWKWVRGESLPTSVFMMRYMIDMSPFFKEKSNFRNRVGC